jgi:hypothetical protein
MNLAFWMSSAAIVLAKRTTDLAERFVARCQMITSLDALHRVVHRFHIMVNSGGAGPAVIAKEGPLYDALQAAAPHKGEMADLRNNVAAHVDHKLESDDDDLSKYCEGIQSFNMRMEPVLLATERYMRFAWEAGLDDWITAGETDQSIRLVQKTLGPLIIGKEVPYVPGGPGPVMPSTFGNDLHEAHASDKTPEQTKAEVARALDKERERLKRVTAEGRKMIPPDTNAATLAEIDKQEAAILTMRMNECEQKARDYKP